jgi:micrococcal nuclease
MYTYKYKVTRVIDGDTIEGIVELGFDASIKLRVRLADVDTPEIFRPKSEAERSLGLKATKFVENQVLNKQVILKTIKDKKGKYGRYIGYIYQNLESDKSLNELLVENKLTKSDVTK